MCGIAAIVAPRGVDLDELTTMSERLAHRGPDGHGYLVVDDRSRMELAIGGGMPRLERRGVVGLAHRRLAILDTSDASAQPMVDSDRGLAVLYNGEIYNYVELRRELESLGATFRTSGDTEVLLRAYARWGSACVERFVGMWSFLLLDLRERRLLVCRDRFGIKPLFWTEREGALYFASEIKALLALPGQRREPDRLAVARYLAEGLCIHGPRTFFEGIGEFPAAHLAELCWDDDRVAAWSPRRYWAVPEHVYGDRADSGVRALREQLVEAVRSHSRSDVPIGTCLSGGLDSSSLVCIAEELRRRGEVPQYTHHGFGYVADDPRYSEESFMNEVVRASGARFERVPLPAEQVTSVVPRVIADQDEPFHSASMVVQWMVFRAARAAGIRVMLDGQGSDEILGGYHGYFPVVAERLVADRRLIDYARFRAAVRKEHGLDPLPLRVAVDRLVPDAVRRCIASSRRRHGGSSAPASASLVPGELVMSAALRNSLPARQVPRAGRSAPRLRDILARDLTSGALPALLRYEDRSSMAHSIESRVPFLDHRVVELVFSFPDEWKVHGTTTKWALREAMQGIVPDAIVHRRDKVGFRADPGITATFLEAMRGELAPSRTALEREWLDEPAVARAFEPTAVASPAGEYAAWRIINLKLWARAAWPT